jgi:hypothetical protein
VSPETKGPNPPETQTSGRHRLSFRPRPRTRPGPVRNEPGSESEDEEEEATESYLDTILSTAPALVDRLFREAKTYKDKGTAESETTSILITTTAKVMRSLTEEADALRSDLAGCRLKLRTGSAPQAKAGPGRGRGIRVAASAQVR